MRRKIFPYILMRVDQVMLTRQLHLVSLTIRQCLLIVPIPYLDPSGVPLSLRDGSSVS